MISAVGFVVALAVAVNSPFRDWQHGLWRESSFYFWLYERICG